MRATVRGRSAPSIVVLIGVFTLLGGCTPAPDDQAERWPLSEVDGADTLTAARDEAPDSTAPEEPEVAAVREAEPGPAPAVPSRPYRAPERVTLPGAAGGPTADEAPAAPDGLMADANDPTRADVARPTGPDSSTAEERPATATAGSDSVGTADGIAPGEPADSTPAARTAAERFPRPEHIRGLYVNAWAAGSSRRMSELLEIAATTEVNTFVIDIKDATGYVSHRTNVPLAREVGADGEIRIRDLPGLLDRLEEAGIYPIARLVVVKDPILAASHPQTAIQDTAGGVWIDSKEIIWQNLFNEDLWAYNVAIAREVAEMGFPEIQWDYIRFPDAPESDLNRAVWPGSEGRLRVDAVRGFLAYAREELDEIGVESTADVFGITTSFNRDVGIGQLWETFIDVVDVALPMVYPSHYYAGSFGYDAPNAYPYEIVHAALLRALRRSATVEGAGLTRPWLQDFTLGPPTYGAAEVRAQIQATYDVGIQEWILWNPSTRYTVAALEPAGGFENEPLVRVAGLLAPVSRRRAVMDSVEVAARLTLEAPDSVSPPQPAPDLLTAGDSVTLTDSVALTDSVGVADSVAAMASDSVTSPDSAGPAGSIPVDTLGTARR